MTDTHAAAPVADGGVAQPTPPETREPTLKEELAAFEAANPSAPEQPQPAAGAAPPPAVPNGDTGDDEIRSYVRQKREEDLRAETDKAVTDAIGILRDSDDALSDMPDRVAEGLLYSEAQRNPDFQRAYAVRHQSPAVWQTALKELGKSVSADISSKPDAKLTAGREAARASVSGISQTKSAPDDAQKAFEERVSKMNPAELDAYIKTHS